MAHDEAAPSVTVFSREKIACAPTYRFVRIRSALHCTIESAMSARHFPREPEKKTTANVVYKHLLL